ncbi:tandem-95 repeat protein [Marinomonas vulgaris]|uniref:tandem-95 repeat protein n=1 Tax=Marinomonas vulgaris TaxID=2823372 RepID=UPI002E285D68|nr:tandem-95 repeat protein [Marinomonas vulgaris]
MAENGDWTFVANSAFNELNVGDSKAESFTVTSVDGTEQVVTVTINGTNDAPVLSITENVIITADDVTIGANSAIGNGYTLTAYSNFEGIDSTNNTSGGLTAITNTSHDGIGVNAPTTNGSDDTSEIGVDAGQSEAIVVTFDDAVTSVDASFGWLSNTETATYTFYSGGEQVGESTFGPGTNTVNDAGTLSVTDAGGNLTAFDTIVFTATYKEGVGTNDNDYLLNSLTFGNLVTADETLTAIEGGKVISGTVSATDVDDDDSSLTYSLVGNKPAGFSFDAETGAWSFDPTNAAYDSLSVGDKADVTVTVKVEDPQGATDTQTITITVTGTNDGPVAVNDTATGTEDGGVITIDVLDNDTDVDGDDLTITAATVPAEQGTVAIVDGQLEFTPAENFNGEATISYTISDGEESSSAEVAVTVDAVNDGPVAVNDTATGTEDGGVITIDVLDNDTDVDGDDLTITAATVPAEQGTVAIVDGQLEFTPAENFNGEATISYTISDGEESSSAEVAVTVDAVNDAPVLSVIQDVTITTDDVTDEVNSVSGNGYTLSAYEKYEGIVDGNVVGTPTNLTTITGGNHDGIGVDAITTNGTDKVSEIGSTVDNAEAIVVTFDDAVTSVDASFGWLSNAETATYTFYSNGEQVGESATFDKGNNTVDDAGTLSVTDGNDNLVAFDTIVFTATYEEGVGTDDNDYLLNSLTFENLVKAGEILTAIEGGKVISGTVSATDVDDDDSSLVYSLVDSENTPAGFSFDTETGAWSFDPTNAAYDSLSLGVATNVEVTVQVKDPQGATDTQTITITVTGTNDGPVAVDDTANGTEDGGVITIDVLANDSDVDGDTLTITGATVPEAQGTVAIVGGKLEFTPAKDFSGEVKIDYSIEDGNGGTDSAVATVVVNAVADLPTLSVSLSDAVVDAVIVKTADPISELGNVGDNRVGSSNLISDSVTKEFDFGSDYSGQTVIISFNSTIKGDWEDGSRNSTADTYTVVINDDQVGQFTFDGNGSREDSYSVTLDEDGKATITFDVTSTSPSEVVNITDIQASFDSAFATSQLTITGTETDTDGSETLSYTISSLPDGVVLLNSDGDTVTANSDGTYSLIQKDVAGLQIRSLNDLDGFELTVTVTSTDGDSVSEPVSQTIIVGNMAPVISDIESVSLNEDGLIDGVEVSASGTFTLSDANNDDLSVSLVAPTQSYTSGGVALVWAVNESGALIGSADGVTIVTVTLGDVDDSGEASYTVSLSGAIDHSSDVNDEQMSIDFGVAVSDGTDTTTSTVSAVIADDTPEATTTTATLSLAASTFSVSSIASGFSAAEFDTTSTIYNGSRVGQSSSVDDDAADDEYDEVISWGNAAFVTENTVEKVWVSWPTYEIQTNAYDEGESSITASEVASGSDSFGFGDNLVVAQISHKNDGVISSAVHYGKTYDIADNLSSTLFNAKVVMNIAGESVTVDLSSTLTVDETTNAGDIMTLKTSSTIVLVNGVSYTVYLDGFLVDGVAVETVTTPEETTVSYDVAAHVKLTYPTENLNTLTGTLETDAGADGLDSVVEATTEDVNGTLVVNEDGTYSFTPSDDLIDLVGSAGSQVVEYSYTVIDGDGDTVENTLSITVTGSVEDTSTTTTVSGLAGNFFNYDDSTDGNLASIAKAEEIISSQSANATFIGTEINYASASGDLGRNSNLTSWLGDDADTLTYVDKDNTEDSVVQLTGSVSLDAGVYSIKVTADDGYQIKINGEVVASVDGIQSEATDTFEFTVADSGEQSIEIIYWDQGGAYTLSVSLASVTELVLEDSDYQVLGSAAYPTTSVITDVSDIVDDVIDDTGTGTDTDTGETNWSTKEELEAAHTDEKNQYGKENGIANPTDISDGHWHANYVEGDDLANTISAGDLDDVVYGEDGNDLIYGESDDDTLHGGDGNDYLDGGSDKDTLYGDDGDDYLLGQSEDDILHGGEGNDYLDGGSQNDILYGGAGNDLLLGSYDDDKLYGGSDNDYLDGGAGQDELDGGDGDDVLYGQGGNDTLIGGAGNDYLDSGDGTDHIDGGEGNDYLVGGGGVDTLTGGEGADIFALNYEWSATDVLTDFNATEDVLDVSDLLDVPDGDDIQTYLDQNLSITSESVTAVINNNENNRKTVATFGDDAEVTSGTVTVRYDDQDYSINIDG